MSETRKGLFKKLKALGPLPKDQRNKIACTFIGHSNIVEGCFGYVHCGRCGTQIGDSIGGVYSNDKVVIIGHGCDICNENYNKLTWEDKLYVPFASNKDKLLGNAGTKAKVEELDNE